ncbi:cilia- and flagella-associated protein 54-like [Limanda limanda]|uniref:cilia- and flagella-associated protein 54-like n=1 Tax=Limanda limanda TaxID=27771 RepID=UPI0029C73867|nr:cilia- and flagella-associated protein 54-like [Limanda limanda]
MEFPASYYGKLDKRNPVITAFERDINSFMTLMKRVASSRSKVNSDSYVRGIKFLVDIWKKFKHRLPPKMYDERMLQVADFLFGIKLYQLALWMGYSHHLQQFNSVKITDITSVDHFMASFFPEGFDTDQDVFALKIRAMQGCALCLFELEKRHSVLRQDGLSKLLRVLNFTRIMMQALQQHEHLCWHMYNGSIHIYTICRYLMTMNYSSQALEYLLWASISLELSVPLMTVKNLSWIVTLYCAVCHCYYDNQAAVQAAKFARRALGKINELAEFEGQSPVPATREAQRAYKEASIKLDAMMFKRAVHLTKRKPKFGVKLKPKSSLKDVSWPRDPTERLLMAKFDSSAAQFFCILEALWDSTTHLLQKRMPEEPELVEVIVELLSAGISILSGVATTKEQKSDSQPRGCLSALTPTSTLMDLAITGENKVPVMSAVRFIKLLFLYKQPDAFTELSREMLQVLSGVEGVSFRKAEIELALLNGFNNLMSSEGSRPKYSNITDDSQKASLSMSDEFIYLVDTLHKSACGSALEVQPDEDLVVDVMLFLWGRVKVVMQRDIIANPDLAHYLEKWLWSLSRLTEVAFVHDLASVDCITMTEMIHTLVVLLESAAERSTETPRPEAPEAVCGGVTACSFALPETSSTELLQKVCEMARRGFTALAKGIATLMPPDSSAITDSVFMQKCCPLPPLSPRLSSETWSEKGDEDDEISEKEKEQMETKTESDIKDSRENSSTSLLLLAKDLHQKLDIIYHRACLKLLQLNAVAESELMDRINKNKVSKALFLIQKALLLYNSMEIDKSRKTKNLLEEASSLIEKAEVEERRLYISTISKTPAEDLDKGQNEEEENPPPPPILLSRTDHALTFAPAPYNLEGQVCWYQLCGLAVEGINKKVRLRDCFLQGTGILVPARSSECVLRVEGLVPNQKYIFAVAAYNSQGTLLGNSIGRATFPLLASMPVPLLSTWAHLAQVAFQAEQYPIAKRACSELWSHFTLPDPGSHSSHDSTVTTRLREQTLELSSPHLRKLFLISIFIETEINIQQGSLLYGCKNGPFIWEQEVRLAECERVLVAMDLAMYLEDGLAAVQAVVSCYGLLAPLIFHQIPCKPAVQVLKKCLIVLENSDRLKQKWTRNISEALMHMIACITYYLSKACLALRGPPMAGSMMDSGRKLLKEVYEVQMQIRRVPNEASKCPDRATVKFDRKSSCQLKALHVKNKKIIPPQAATSTDNENSSPMTSSEDPTIFYEVIFYNPLRDAYENVMRVRRKAAFPEYAALLLQRTLKEGCLDLVLKWGQSMFEYLARRDKVILEALEGNGHNKSVQVSKGNESPQNTSKEDARNKLKQKKLHSMFQRVITNRELQAVENLLTTMSSVVQRRMKQLKLRNLYCEERVWKSHFNYSMAKAHLALFYQGLDQLHGNTLQQRFSQLNLLYFSLAYSGVLVRRNSQQQPSTEYGIVSERDSSHPVVRVPGAARTDKDEAVRVDKIAKEENCEEQEASKTPEQQIEKKRRTASMMLDSISKSALHLKRAMVLAHRGSHWTTLQHVSHTVWNLSCRIASLAQTATHLELDSPLTAEQLHTTITQLLSMATDLIMDMLTSLGLWSLYDSDLTEEELGSSVHFSASLDDSTHVDLRWVCTLVLHTLERLHYCGKWESLAHFALLFNSYTRERYVSITTPLLVHAQRRLLERISCFGGPAAPQPHHARTQKVTGEKVTYRSYAGCQLLCGWTPQHAQQPPSHINSETTNASRQEAAELKGLNSHLHSSMSLVCVPLDIEDTLSCYHQAFERRPDCLRVFQHSRSLLMRLLANTQPCFAAQMQGHSENQVHFNPNVMPPPSIQHCELTEEDYSNPDVLYGLPISADHLPIVTAAYSSSIKYLQAYSKDSLRIQALHEMGNLHFYNGNIRAAHSSWSKAVDCALQSSGAVEKWDGLSFGGCSLQETLKQAGIWGCLQAAVLTAKIAQHILTSDIRQRTKYCLLSAHLFKCVLCCSLTQPRDDLLYASYSIGDELLPGVDLFTEPHRVHLATTVTSLNFICHWLFTTGYWITLLPMLAIYLHFVGTVCRDVQRVVAGKILKIHALTELCLYTEAVKEAGQLTQGIGILLPDGRHIAKDEDHQPMKTFYSNKSVMENAEALAELMNCHCAPVVRKLYGSTLCLRFNLARVQLVLALTNTIPGPSVSDTAVSEACASGTSVSINSKSTEQKTDAESDCPKTEEIKVLDLDTDKMLTPGSMKFLLLEGVSTLLQFISQQLTLQGRSEIENLELTIQTNLLKANHYLQQGHVELSSQMAVSSLELLQTSHGRFLFKNAEPELPHPRTGSEQGTKDCCVSNTLHGDCPRAIEASEKIGVSLWLRCRLALVCSLTAQSCGTATLFSGKNMNEEAARLLQEGLNECALWGDIENQALLMVEAAELEAQRGNTDDSMALLQEVVSLLSGRPCIPPRSCMTLARATLLFSDLKSAESTALLKVAQKLLQNQLCVFGENVVLEDGNLCFPPPGPCNIYLPYRSILNQITLQITKCLT